MLDSANIAKCWNRKRKRKLDLLFYMTFDIVTKSNLIKVGKRINLIHLSQVGELVRQWPYNRINHSLSVMHTCRVWVQNNRENNTLELVGD